MPPLGYKRINFSKRNPNYFFLFNKMLLPTTLTLLRAMAAPAIMGFNRNPLKGYKIPAAMGMPMIL
jgi:hypothetical protein